MEKQISIIIPTYNMEAYIGRCLDSLLIADFDKVEVLVVNDGSKDRSSEIAHGYESRFPDSIRVIDKPNGNYGSCINAALPLCTGRYVKVLDADDTFDREGFGKMVEDLDSADEDLIVTDFETVDSQGNVEEVFSFVNADSKIALSIDKLLNYFTKRYVNMHAIAYSMDVFKRFSYHQTEGISYTDTQWSLIPLVFCKDFKVYPYVVYKYLVGRAGQTVDAERMKRSYGQLFRMMRELVAEFSKLNRELPARDSIFEIISHHHRYYYDKLMWTGIADNTSLLKNYDIDLETNYKELYDCLGNMKYARQIDYFHIRDFREKDYPVKFGMPLLRRIELSLKTKLERCFGIRF